MGRCIIGVDHVFNRQELRWFISQRIHTCDTPSEGPMPAAFRIDRSLDRGRMWTVYHEGIAPTAPTFTDPAPAGAFPCYRVSAIATPPARSSPPSHFACLAGPGATAPSPLGGRHGSP